ncbi:nuclear transport factor 2 family protein [Mucilaginibacter sp.]|uniref:nuclear transport factor 2 family protein n=1 Tax=Mucilaginibacter sp. TaxID=1882438 RepID=UPI003262E56D
METIKEIVQKINQAFRDSDMETFTGYCADDVVWTMVGSSAVTGKQGILDFMKGMPTDCEPVLQEKLIFAGENNVTCTGTMEMPSSNGGVWKGGFCDIYQFVDGKIKTLETYVVEFKQKD